MTDRFELLEELGAGGMGSVWKARDSETGEIVALKLVHPHLARDPDYVARFEREVEVARRVDSPHVVRVLGYGTRDGIPFMSMEYVEGQSLRDFLRERGKLTWDEAKPIVRQVAEGLGAAHAAGIIHRDVKPSNILITPDGDAKLADFGIARALDMTRLTGSSTMLGTPHYMAPDTEVTPASDLYSLGCVVYEMLTGRPPFDGDTQQQIIARHMRLTPDLSGISPADACRALERLLDKRPSRRIGALQGARDESPEATVAERRRVRPLVRTVATMAAVLMLGGCGAALGALALRDDPPGEVVLDPTSTKTLTATPTPHDDQSRDTSTPSIPMTPYPEGGSETPKVAVIPTETSATRPIPAPTPTSSPTQTPFAFTPDAVPTNLHATVRGSAVVLSWDYGGHGQDRFLVGIMGGDEAGYRWFGNAVADGHSLSLTPEPDAIYCHFVVAYVGNGAGNLRPNDPPTIQDSPGGHTFWGRVSEEICYRLTAGRDLLPLPPQGWPPR